MTLRSSHYSLRKEAAICARPTFHTYAIFHHSFFLFCLRKIASVKDEFSTCTMRFTTPIIRPPVYVPIGSRATGTGWPDTEDLPLPAQLGAAYQVGADAMIGFISLGLSRRGLAGGACSMRLTGGHNLRQSG